MKGVPKGVFVHSTCWPAFVVSFYHIVD